MTFLQPWLLFALPLALLPIVIHLINQRRFQTIAWGAMMFLLAAHRMNRGYSRLRQWLILAARMLAVAGLIVAVSRPLAGGWLGLAAGGRADAAYVLLDRSPSMQQRGDGGASKLETGARQLARVFQTFAADHWRLVDGASGALTRLESPAQLPERPDAAPVAASADLPAMLQTVHDDVRDNRTGRTEIWICSDLRANDWAADSARWAALRKAFLEFPQTVRFHLLAYPRPAESNVAVRVTEARRRETTDAAEILVSVQLARRGEADGATTIPVQFEIEGARSVVPVEMTGDRVDLRDHPIPIERGRRSGWGRVSIPADANPADDDFYFVFDDPPPRRTILVSDDPAALRPLALAAEISADPDAAASVERVPLDQTTGLEWDEIALVLWQAPLPSGAAADLVRGFVDRGGRVVFFPPRDPDDAEIFGVRWGAWSTGGEPAPVETWRGDEDLLARAQSGAALPVGDLEVRRFCSIEGDFTALASLRGGAPLVVRAATDRGAAYFWSTTPAPRDSSLATNGVVLYAFVQRALAAGAAVLAKARQVDAGDDAVQAGDSQAWVRLAGPEETLSTEYPFQAGVYQVGDKRIAVNRSQAEDEAKVLSDARVHALFDGLDFSRIDDQAGSGESLIQEIWRTFLVAMLLAMILEAVLCLPSRRRPTEARP